MLIDLKQAEAEAAAKDLVDWFGVQLLCFTSRADRICAVTHGEAKEGEIHARGIGCDVSSEESVKAAFAQIKQEFGHIDVSMR